MMLNKYYIDDDDGYDDFSDDDLYDDDEYI